MTLRDAIKDAIESNVGMAEEYDPTTGITTGTWEWDAAADAILALIRERLTSGAVVTAALPKVYVAQLTPGFNQRAIDRAVTRAAITAALDAIAGEQP